MDPERQILLMADYYSDPVWWASDSAMAELDALPLSAETKAALRAWAEWFDEGCEPRFGHQWRSEEHRRAFDREGRRLLGLIREELGDEWSVGYFCELTAEHEWPLGSPPPRAAGW